MVWRVYCGGVEFGRDYVTLAQARTAKLAYARHWPRLRYTIRQARG